MSEQPTEITVYDDGHTSIVFYPLTGAVSIKKKYKNPHLSSYILVEEAVETHPACGTIVLGYSTTQHIVR